MSIIQSGDIEEGRRGNIKILKKSVQSIFQVKKKCQQFYKQKNIKESWLVSKMSNKI